jgi:hypothetical protein
VFHSLFAQLTLYKQPPFYLSRSEVLFTFMQFLYFKEDL